MNDSVHNYILWDIFFKSFILLGHIFKTLRKNVGRNFILYIRNRLNQGLWKHLVYLIQQQCNVPNKKNWIKVNFKKFKRFCFQVKFLRPSSRLCQLVTSGVKSTNVPSVNSSASTYEGFIRILQSGVETRKALLS